MDEIEQNDTITSTIVLPTEEDYDYGIRLLDKHFAEVGGSWSGIATFHRRRMTQYPYMSAMLTMASHHFLTLEKRNDKGIAQDQSLSIARMAFKGYELGEMIAEIVHSAPRSLEHKVNNLALLYDIPYDSMKTVEQAGGLDTVAGREAAYSALALVAFSRLSHDSKNTLVEWSDDITSIKKDRKSFFIGLGVSLYNSYDYASRYIDHDFAPEIARLNAYSNASNEA